MRTWENYGWAMAGVAAEVLGAAEYLEANPDYATDAVLADAWRRYVEKFREASAANEPQAG